MTVSVQEGEIARLAAKAESLRASIARAHLELKNASAQERAITERLAQLAKEGAPASERPRPSAPEPRTSPEPAASDAAGDTREPAAETVITWRKLDAWRRRAICVAIGAAAVTALSVVALTQLASPPRPPAKAVALPAPSPHAPAETRAPAAATTPAETKAPAAATTPAETSAPVAPPARTSRIAPPPKPPTFRTRGAPPPAPTPGGAEDILGAALDGEPTRGGQDDSLRSGLPVTRPTGLGSLTVVCLPVKCDDIRVDGISIGAGHIFGRPIAAGSHVLTAHAPNGVERVLSIDVRPDQLRDVRLATFADPGGLVPSRL